MLTGPTHLAFQAPDRATVDRFLAAAVAAGGKDNGAPGERPYHPGYYAAFALDPDGNNIEVVHHGPAKEGIGGVHRDRVLKAARRPTAVLWAWEWRRSPRPGTAR